MTSRSTATRCATVIGLVLLAAFAAAGCTTTGTSGPPPPPPPPSSECTAHYAAFRQPLEVAVVLDRSCAMQTLFDGVTPATGPTDPEGRWGAVAAALEAAGANPTIAAWSLLFSPEDPAMCTLSGELAIFSEPYSGELIPEVLAEAGASPFDVCASGTSEVPLEAALGVLNGSEDIGSVSEPFVLVIAAGAPSCGSTTTTLEDAAANTPYDLVVLGLAPDATAAPLIEALALPDEEGLRPNYRLAASAAEVQSQIDEILAARQSCSLELVSQTDVPVRDEADLHVWVDGEPVAGDPENGWVLSLDGTITLNGALCDRLRAGEVQRIDASLGCDERLCVAIDPDEEGDGEESCDGLDNDCDDTVDEDCG